MVSTLVGKVGSDLINTLTLAFAYNIAPGKSLSSTLKAGFSSKLGDFNHKISVDFNSLQKRSLKKDAQGYVILTAPFKVNGIGYNLDYKTTKTEKFDNSMSFGLKFSPFSSFGGNFAGQGMVNISLGDKIGYKANDALAFNANVGSSVDIFSIDKKEGHAPANIGFKPKFDLGGGLSYNLAKNMSFGIGTSNSVDFAMTDGQYPADRDFRFLPANMKSDPKIINMISLGYSFSTYLSAKLFGISNKVTFGFSDGDVTDIIDDKILFLSNNDKEKVIGIKKTMSDQTKLDAIKAKYKRTHARLYYLNMYNMPFDSLYVKYDIGYKEKYTGIKANLGLNYKISKSAGDKKPSLTDDNANTNTGNAGKIGFAQDKILKEIAKKKGVELSDLKDDDKKSIPGMDFYAITPSHTLSISAKISRAFKISSVTLTPNLKFSYSRSSGLSKESASDFQGIFKTAHTKAKESSGDDAFITSSDDANLLYGMYQKALGIGKKAKNSFKINISIGLKANI